MAKMRLPYACLQMEYTWWRLYPPMWGLAMRSRNGKALICRDRTTLDEMPMPFEEGIDEGVEERHEKHQFLNWMVVKA